MTSGLVDVARASAQHHLPRYRRAWRTNSGELGALLLVAAVAAGCGAGAGSADPATAPTATSAPLLVSGRGGSATVALSAIPTNLNDHTVAGDTDATRLVDSAVWAQVFQVGPGLKPKLDTAVVQTAEVVSVDPQTVVYQIAPKARWSDGSPLTAADFQYAWQSQRGGALDLDGTPDSVASTLGYRDIASVVGSDGGRTVTVTFHTPFADWESLFDDLLPSHVADQVGWNTGFTSFDAHNDVSAGPWVITKWHPGQEVVLDRNPKWWGPPARFRQIILEAVTNPTVLARDIRAGSVQVAAPATYNAPLVAALSDLPDTKSATRLGTTILQLEFNVRRSPLDSAAVRQGIAHDIDRVALVTQTVQPLQHYTWLDNSHLFANMQTSYSDDGTGYQTSDPPVGAGLLGQGGLVADSHGTWTLHGTPVTLNLTWADDDPWAAAVGPLVASQLQEAGFDVNVTPVPTSELFGAVLPGGDFDLALVPTEASAYPSSLETSYSPTVPPGTGTGSEDWSGFDDPKIDTLFTEAEENLSANQAGALYQQIDQDLWADMPTLPLMAEPQFLAYSASLSGIQPDAGGLGVLWEMDQWAPLIKLRPAGPKRSERDAARANMPLAQHHPSPEGTLSSEWRNRQTR